MPEPTSTSAVERIATEAIRVLGLLVDYEEGRLLHHSWRVGLMAHELTRAAGLGDPALAYYAGILHDIGGARLPEHVVHQAAGEWVTPGAFTHVPDGVRLLEKVTYLAPLAEVVADHHENWDGSGYPLGKREGEIRPEALAVHLADLLDVELRWLPPEDRWPRTQALVRHARTRQVPEGLADAALDLLGGDPGLLEDVFDDARLTARLDAMEVSFPWARHGSRIDVLSSLLWLAALVADSRHESLLGHSHRTAWYATRIALELGSDTLNPWHVLWAGLAHDLGMAAVARSILEKAGPLRLDWIETIRSHVATSAELIGSIREAAFLAPTVAAHHERYDGTGYPDGRSEEDIPILARVLAAADVYDALTSDRPYRRALPHEEALSELERCAGGHLDPVVAAAAVRALRATGPLTGTFPDTPEAFLALCESRDFPFPRHEDSERAGARPVRTGVLLLPTEPWVLVELDAKGVPKGDLEGLGRLLGRSARDLETRPLTEWLDARSRRKLEAWLEDLQASQTCTDYLYTEAGRPIEAVLLAASPSRTLLLLRSAANRLEASSDLALSYRTFLDSTQPTALLDRDGVIQDANRALLDLTGRRLPELVGKSPDRGLLGEEAVWQEAWASARNRNVARWQGRTTVRGAGRLVPVHLGLRAVRDPTGEHVGYVLSLEDLTEQLARERLLFLLTETLLELGPDFEDNVQRLVRAAAEIGGASSAAYTVEGSEGLEIVAVHPAGRPTGPRDLEAHRTLRQEASRKPVRLVAEPRTGSRPETVYCHGVGLHGRPIGLLCVQFPKLHRLAKWEEDYLGGLAASLGRQEELRAARASLQASEERFRLLAEKASDVVWAVDRDGRISFVNEAVSRVFGLSPQEAMGRPALELLPHRALERAISLLLPDTQRAEAQRALASRDAPALVRIFWPILARGRITLKFELPVPDGRPPRFLELEAGIVQGDRMAFVHGLVRDVTHQRLREAELARRAEAAERLSEIKSEVLAAASHDLKAPAHAILSYLNLLESRLDSLSTERLVRHLKRIRAAAEGLLRTVTDAVDLERMEAGILKPKFEKVDLRPLIEEAAREGAVAAAPRGISIQLDLDGRLREAHLDGAALRRILANLLSNATKFSPNEAAVLLRGLRLGSDWLRLEVADKGPGIQPADLEAVFGKFYRSKPPPGPASGPPGSGLGLAIVHRLAEDMGGEVWAEPARGGGARFVLELPLRLEAGTPPRLLHVGPSDELWGLVESAALARGWSARTVPAEGPVDTLACRRRRLVIVWRSEPIGELLERCGSATCLVVGGAQEGHTGCVTVPPNEVAHVLRKLLDG